MEGKRFEQIHKKPTSEDLDREKQLRASFDDQWNAPDMLRIGDESFRMYDVRPTTEKTGVPILAMPGWSHTPDVWKENIRHFNGAGRRVITVEAPHGSVESLALEAELPATEARRLTPFIKMLEAKGVGQVDAVAHSLGAMDALIAASLYPEKFRNIILINPPGLHGKDNVFRLARGFAAGTAKENLNEARKSNWASLNAISRAGAKAVLGNIPESFKQILTIASTDLSHLLRRLKEKGIGIVVVHAPDDSFFPIERRHEQISKLKQSDDPDEILSILDGVYSVAGTHQSFFLQPEQYSRLVEQALTGLEARGAKTQGSDRLAHPGD
jgi:pimeloyl-ACP methyl ester carboxylesterase